MTENSFTGKNHLTVIPERDYRFKITDLKEEIPDFSLKVCAPDMDRAYDRVQTILKSTDINLDRLLILYESL